MSFKIVLPWLCAAGALAGVGALYVSNQKLSSQLALVQADNQELLQFKATSETNAAQTQATSDELARLRKDNEDLLRLRSEVQRLRQEGQQMAGQLQTAQNQVQSAQKQAQLAQPQMRVWNAADGTLVTTTTGRQQFTYTKPVPGVPTTPEQVAALNTCINNLRQIDGAKQQWALENNKPANTLVSEVNITAYLPGNTMPTCPGGGAYTINSIGTAPTCSMPGHQLAK